MPEVTAEINGLRELHETLTRLGPELAQKVLGAGLAAAEEVLGAALLSHTPKRTGDLASHIVTASQVAPSGTSGIAKAGFGSEGYKAGWVELGHRQVSNGQVVGHVPAHPFMRPASDNSKEDCKNAVLAAASEALEKL
jgi:HK97 gp10 family phage protein